MKRIFFVLTALLLLLTLAIPCFAEEAEAVTEDAGLIEAGKELIAEAGEIIMGVIDVIREYTPEDWRVVIDEQIVPWVTLAISSILSVYIAISPILVKIKKTSDRFDKSSDKLEESKAVAEKAKTQLQSAQAQIEALRSEFDEVKNGYQKMYGSLSNIEKIVRIGFENSDELIVKGYANDISKVGAENEKIEENKAA